MPLITAPYLSRTVGAEGIGIYAYYYAIAHYFYLFGKLGLNNYGAREIAINKDNKENKDYTFSSIYYQQILVTVIVIVMYFIFCIFNLKDNNFIPMILGFYTIGCLLDIDWLYVGVEKFVTIALKNITVKVITLVAIFIFVKDSGDLWIYTLIMSLGMLIGFVTLWFGIKKEVNIVKVKFKDVTKHIKPNFILLFPILAANIYHSIDKIMVGKMSSMTELGYYDNAEKIVYGISGFITAFTNIMMPRCSNLIHRNNEKKCKEYILYTMDFLYFIILLIGSVCCGIAKTIILVLFGKDFNSSIILLQALALTLPFMIWSEVIRSMWVIPKKRDKAFLITLSLAAVLDVIFNAILIPKYDALGACIGTIIAEMSIPLTQFIIFRKDLPYLKLIAHEFFLITGAIITFLILNLIQSLFTVNILSLILLLMIGTIIYIIVDLIIFIIFRRDTLKMVINYGMDMIKFRKIKGEQS